MRVFVTGASGFIGSAIVKELISAGHEVTGLARSDASAAFIAAAGAAVHRGTIEDPDSLKRGAAAADGVIHTAFIHDFADFKANCEKDRRTIETLGSVLAGSNRPLIISSGIGVISPGRLASEEDMPSTSVPRVASEEAAGAIAAHGVRVSAMRLPPSVHDQGDHGFLPTLINIAREKGVSAYIGDGTNRWPAVHRLDAAHAFRLALEKGAPYPRFHAVDDEGVPTRKIAEAIGRHLNLPVVSKSPEEAAAHFGWIGHFFALDVPASSKQTREWLGWRPTHPSLLADLDKGHYFQPTAPGSVNF
ncbi:MAG TPA: SDR family oxidoreductase [Puia sp.]|nr:SDR family oxidoreductase [Puia sp.]